MIKDGGQNHTKGATINRFHVQVHVIVAPTEIKLFEGFKIVLLMHCFYLIVCISKQEEKWSIWLSIEKFLTNFYKSTLLVASDLNLCAIKSAFTWLLMNHFNFLLLLLLGEGGGEGKSPKATTWWEHCSIYIILKPFCTTHHGLHVQNQKINNDNLA